MSVPENPPATGTRTPWPTVRGFQHAQGVMALKWLRHRTGWA
ncbi:hypothetical protein ACQEUU_07615 [Nonomuraea sp. CA-218870]